MTTLQKRALVAHMYDLLSHFDDDAAKQMYMQLASIGYVKTATDVRLKTAKYLVRQPRSQTRRKRVFAVGHDTLVRVLHTGNKGVGRRRSLATHAAGGPSQEQRDARASRPRDAHSPRRGL